MPKDLNGAQTGMTPSNSVNNPRPDNKRGRNVFPQSYLHLTTDRYGEYSPFYWAKCERGDVQNLQTDHNLHTFTLKSPMVSNVTMTKSFVKVPMEAIYPRNWEKMMTIPTHGDDVPADTRALLDVRALVDKLVDNIKTQDGAIFLKSIILLELITSHGSLFERFNMHFNFVFDPDGSGEPFSPDAFFDSVYSSILDVAVENNLGLLGPDDVTYYVTSNSSISFSSEKYVSPRRFLEMLRSGSFSLADSWENLRSYLTDYIDLSDFSILSGFRIPDDGSLDHCLNIEPIISYQLACAQFGTNDFVDYIFSAQLYRENMQSLINQASTLQWFTYNGVDYLYDVFSHAHFSKMISYSFRESALDFFMNLFRYNNSLRYGDYFTGAKPRPLAVGEYSAAVTDNSVSAIDITKSIQMQRLLNRVNMVGRKLGDYLAGIFGGPLPEAPKDVPVFLAHQRFDINGFETENTGDIQFAPNQVNTITSHLRSSANRHSFEIEIDEPCYLIGMNSYESLRVYSKTIDRFAFHHDRYDDFIPEMQYIGDQDIKRIELECDSRSLVPYGYSLRYMEYKQRYSYASGGFIDSLPSWAFITDNSDGNPPSNFINPDYIRSSPTEFDRFYKSLNGYSLGSYFHFIICHNNVTAPSRMMEYTPEILK